MLREVCLVGSFWFRKQKLRLGASSWVGGCPGLAVDSRAVDSVTVSLELSSFSLLQSLLSLRMDSELSLVMNYYAERTDCSAFTLREIPGAGRGLVAVRDIPAGQSVLCSQSAVRGPCARAPAQCLNCLKLLQPATNNQCRKCLLQVCSESCSAG